MSDGVADDGGQTTGSRDRILDAAAVVFGEKGYAGATTKEIAERAKVNEVTVFRTFKSKSGLFEATLSQRFPRAQLMKELHFDRSRDAAGALEENTIAFLNVLHQNRNAIMMHVLDLPRMDDDPRFRNMLSSAFIGPLEGYLASQMDGGKMRPHDPEMAARIYYGMVISYFLQDHIDRKGASNPQADLRQVRVMVAIFLHGLHVGTPEDNAQPFLKRPR